MAPSSAMAMSEVEASLGVPSIFVRSLVLVSNRNISEMLVTKYTLPATLPTCQAPLESPGTSMSVTSSRDAKSKLMKLIGRLLVDSA